MAHPILMPKAGQTMTEGRLIGWIKKEGDSVERGEPLLEIETDKANLEVESTESGVLRKIFAGEGDVCPVLTVVGILGDADEDIDFEAMREAGDKAAAEAAAAIDDSGPSSASSSRGATPPSLPSGGAADSRPARPAVAPTTASAGVALTSPPSIAASPSEKSRRFASPLARRVAEKKGVDISLLSGSGPGGRVLRRDVENAPKQMAGGPGPVDGLPGRVDLDDLTRPRPYAPPSPRPPERIALKGMRGAIAAALQHSKQTIPHFYETMTIDVTAALSLKRNLEIGGKRVSVNDLVVRACVLAITDEPRMNCRVLEDHVDYPEDVNIGIAVGTENGLVVPVVVGAQTLDLEALAAESRRVIESARGGKLIGTGKGTFTISNLGMFGVESFSAIINPPEGAILAVGAVRPEVLPYAGGFVPRAMMSVTLSADHRAIDGVLAAQFLARLKWLLENPSRL